LADELVRRGRPVIAESCSTWMLVAHAVALERAVLVLDGRFSGADLRAVAGGSELEPGVAVLVVGPVRPNTEVLVAFASGISGYLPPDSGPGVIADAVSVLCAGEVVWPRQTLMLVADQHRVVRGITVDGADGRPVELTHREWEVLVLVRQAYSTAEIARRLVVATVTVRTHIAALVHKLGVPDLPMLAQPLRT
jgi:DNA-binding NarL/FixJ family response regulator